MTFPLFLESQPFPYAFVIGNLTVYRFCGFPCLTPRPEASGVRMDCVSLTFVCPTKASRLHNSRGAIHGIHGLLSLAQSLAHGRLLVKRLTEWMILEGPSKWKTYPAQPRFNEKREKLWEFLLASVPLSGRVLLCSCVLNDKLGPETIIAKGLKTGAGPDTWKGLTDQKTNAIE